VLLDSVPRILNALILALPRRELWSDLTRNEEVRGRIRAHAELCHGLGISVEVVMSEYQLLHEVIMRRLHADMKGQANDTVHDAVQMLVDEAARVTAAEYERPRLPNAPARRGDAPRPGATNERGSS
jgi:hypothetical protein